MNKLITKRPEHLQQLVIFCHIISEVKTNLSGKTVFEKISIPCCNLLIMYHLTVTQLWDQSSERSTATTNIFLYLWLGLFPIM